MNADDGDQRPASSKSHLYDAVLGPLTATQDAAERYRNDWGWPVFASTHQTWLRLPAGMAAISVILPDPSQAVLPSTLAQIAGPTIDYAHGHYTILTSCTTVDPDHVGPGPLNSSVVHLPTGSSVDLPPSIVVGTRAVWWRAPHVDQRLPNCAKTLALIRSLIIDQ